MSFPELLILAVGLAMDAFAVAVCKGLSLRTLKLQQALLNSITPAAALAFMVFVLLYFPCIATFGAIMAETGGWKWAIFSAVYTIVLAWVAAFVVYRGALLF